ncbi:MAG: Y-family DNA polymerase [Rubripirellula sp.]
MKIAQAGELIQFQSGEATCDRVLQKRHDRHLDQEALEQIAVTFQQQICPLVAVEPLDQKPWAGHPRHQSESLLCDISGVSHLFSGEAGLLVAVEELLASLGLRGQMAVADSVGAAWALAHSGLPPRLSPSSSHDGQVENPSEMATRHWIVCGQRETRGAMERLPVEALRIFPEAVATLSRLGVESIQQLLTLPKSGLATRLGPGLVRRIEQALGESDEPLEVHRAVAEHVAGLTLEYPTSDQPILADRMIRLVEKIRAGLAARQRGALRMTCRLDLSGHPPLILEIGLFAPTTDVDHLSGLMINQLEAKRVPACVERLTVSVTLSGPLRSVQNALFQHNDVSSSDACTSGSTISRLVDALSGRLGREAVLGVKIEDDPLPEQSFCVLPLAGRLDSPTFSQLHKSAARDLRRSRLSRQSSLKQEQGVSFQPSPEDALRRPLSLLTEPCPLRVAFPHGSFCLHVSSPRLPERIRLDGRVHEIVMHWGPERIESGWWKGASIGRDYYRIETDQGQWWWIFRNLVSKSRAESNPRYSWMLHGRFS